jgi:Protein of unknown function (DUF3099).
MKQPSITSLPLAPDVERHRRAVKYTIAMGVRVLCLISLLFVHGWWLLIPASGAIFLPYFAVVIANVSSGRQGEVERPGNIVRVEPRPEGRVGSEAPGTAGGDDDQERHE